MDLLAEYGFWYTCDLFQDDQPQPVKTKTGRLISMPYSLEVNDVIVYNSYLQTPNDYGRLLIRHFDQLRKEGAESGTVMCIPLHAYLVGHPYRLKGLEAALDYITSQPDVWVTTAVEIAEHFRAHCWDQTMADVARHRDGQGASPRGAA